MGMVLFIPRGFEHSFEERQLRHNSGTHSLFHKTNILVKQLSILHRFL